MRCPTLSQLPAPPPGKGGWPWREESPQLPDAMPDGHPWPKISIVTPSYNQVRFFEETIRSVLLQGYPHLEYIIIDGGSTDNSVETIKKYQEWLTYWVSEPDRGQSDAINKGFRKASGEIYTWLNSDDYLLKNALRNVATAYYVSPEAGGWFGGCLQVDMNSGKLEVWWPNRVDLEGLATWPKNMIGQPACFFSEKAWRVCGPLEEELHYAMDFDLWLKIARMFSIEKVNEVLAAAHVHEDTKTRADMGMSLSMQWVVQIRHGFERQAILEMSQLVNDYMFLYGKVNGICRFPLFRPILPLARIIWRKRRKIL